MEIKRKQNVKETNIGNGKLRVAKMCNSLNAGNEVISVVQ